MSKRIIIHSHARPDKIEQARAALIKIMEPIRADPECLDFRVFQDEREPKLFIIWEEWTSEEAIMDHSKRDYMKEYTAQKNILFEGSEGNFLQEIQ